MGKGVHEKKSWCIAASAFLMKKIQKIVDSISTIEYMMYVSEKFLTKI
jgi:hypothetical protein